MSGRWALRGLAPLMTAAALLAVLVVPFPASASPYLNIGEGGTISWTDAIATGLVTSVPETANVPWVTQQFYDFTAGAGNWAFVPSVLTPDVMISDGSETHQSMVMSWGETPPGTLPVANWQVNYGSDPDLTDTLICFSLFAPPGVWDISLVLIDVNGNSRGWFLPMPPNQWTNYYIDPENNPGSLPPGWIFYDQPGFDLTKVVTIQLDESGRTIPVNPIPGAPIFWNAWDSFVVQAVPEPSTLGVAVLGMGMGLVVALRRRRCRG